MHIYKKLLITSILAVTIFGFIGIINVQASTATVSVSPASIASGEASIITWSSGNTTSCVISSGASSCSINFSWTTTNPQGTSSITNTSGDTVATGNSGTNIPLSVKYNTETFYLYNNAVLLNSPGVTVSSSCITGTSWDGSKCAPTTEPSGTISSTSCTIASGASTCVSSLVTWATANLIVGANTAVTRDNPPGTTVSTATSGYISNTINYGVSNYYLYHNSIVLASSTANASCVTGTSWDGSKCAPTTEPSGTISSASCTIASGAATCASSVTWTTANLIVGANTAVTRDNPTGTTVSTATSGTNVSNTINYGTSNYYLYHNSVVLASSTANASCATGTSWDGSKCAVLPPAPVATISANPTSVAYGGSSTITWSSTNNATYCTAAASWSGTKTASGSETMSNLTSSKSYAISCTGAGGISPMVYVSVIVGAQTQTPTATISASPTSIASGGTSTITWSSTNATSCTASGDWSGTKATSGNASTGALTSSKTYTITCTGAGGTGTPVSATVTVSAAMSGTLTSTPTSCTIPAGSGNCSVTLAWTTTNPVATSAVTSNYPNANTSIATGNSGSQSVSIPYTSSPRSFYLYNNAVLLATTPVTASCASGTLWDSSGKCIAKGDVNYDGRVSCIDAAMILKHLAHTITLTADQLLRADLTGDGTVSTSDATVILQQMQASGISCTVGDVNGDGTIDCLDMKMILQYGVGTITLTADQQYRADINSDGTVNPQDASLVMANNGFSCPVGDVNRDGAKNCADVGMILKSVVGTITLTADQQYLADVSGDGAVTSYDASLLMSNNGFSCPVGDVNRDGAKNCTDVNMILQSIVETITLTADQQYLADVSGDGTVSANDASLLMVNNGFTCSSPLPPINFTGSAAACGTGKINLSWTASSGATSYVIKQNGTDIPVSITTTSYSVIGLTAGVGYNFSIRASNSTGSSTSVPSVPATINAPAACP
jgi:hypothetical protein